MQEIEKLKVLQSERESFKTRTKQRVLEKNAENQTETACPECGSRVLVQDRERAELVCKNCGLVIDDEFIDRGPEWRAFDAEQRNKRARTGAPMTLTIHDKGLSTMIDWRNKDSYGRSISTKNRAQFYRLRKWQRRIRVSNATERNLAFALSELDRMASALGLPRNIRESTAVVYRDAVDKNLIRGRSIEGVAAAALYTACRQCRVPRTLDEIAEVSRVSRKEIGRTYRFISRELSLRLLPTSPLDYVPRFCSGLKLNGEVQTRTVEILRQAYERELTSGRGPTGVAAAAIYIASMLGGERRTQREVAEVAGVTEVTIRNRYKELAEKLDIEICI
jgi:transcription initiation factor TFIIB